MPASFIEQILKRLLCISHFCPKKSSNHLGHPHHTTTAQVTDEETKAERDVAYPGHDAQD